MRNNDDNCYEFLNAVLLFCYDFFVELIDDG